MLSKYDDFPIHPTPEPIAVPATSDRNVYDRYWFNGYTREGDFYFAAALGLYPHRHVMDCGFSVVLGDQQFAFHGSRRAPLEPSETQVGPFRVEIVEPMRKARVVLEPNDSDLACELEFVPRTAAVEEGRQTFRREGRIVMDATRFAQFGSWRGEIRCGGETLQIEPERVLGTKDRSWGIRQIGEPEVGGAPATSLPQIFFLWAPLHWDDHCTHFAVFEDADGLFWAADGMRVPAYASPEELPGTLDPGVEPMASVSQRIDYRKGTRWARAAEIGLVTRGGERRVIELEPLLRFQMKGVGYLHPEWGHGRWKGELELGGESWKLADLDPLALENLHIQQVVRARSNGQTGIGVLEQIAIGPHAPSGFKSLIDGAA